MKVTAAGTIYDVELPKDGMKFSYKESIAIEKALGITFSSLGDSESIGLAGAIVWTLVKRQAPDVAFDDLDFELEDFFTENEEAPKGPGSSPTRSSISGPAT